MPTPMLVENEKILVSMAGVTIDGRIMPDSVFEEMVETFNHRGYKPGLILGHRDKNNKNSPRLGEIGSVDYNKETGKFYITPSFISKDLRNLMAENKYPYMSIEADPIVTEMKNIEVDGEMYQIAKEKYALTNVALLSGTPAIPEARAGFKFEFKPTEFKNKYQCIEGDVKKVYVYSNVENIGENISLVGGGKENMPTPEKVSEQEVKTPISTTSNDTTIGIVDNVSQFSASNNVNDYADKNEKQMIELNARLNQQTIEIDNKSNALAESQKRERFYIDEFEKKKLQYDQYVFKDVISKMIASEVMGKHELGLRKPHDTNPQITDSDLFERYLSYTETEKKNFLDTLSLRQGNGIVKMSKTPLGIDPMQDALSPDADVDPEIRKATMTARKEMALAMELCQKQSQEWTIYTQPTYLRKARELLKTKGGN